MKVDTELLKLILQRKGYDIREIAEILEDVNLELMNQVEDDKPPAIRKQFVVILSDPEGELARKDFVAWVAQIPADDSPATTLERIHRAAYEYNVSPRGRRLSVRSIGETLEVVGARFFKEQSVWVKTKEPVFVQVTDNVLPRPGEDGAS